MEPKFNNNAYHVIRKVAHESKHAPFASALVWRSASAGAWRDAIVFVSRVAFGSAAEYIAYPRPNVPACLILDLELPDINGLDLQSQAIHDDHPPIVFITGHGDVPSSVRAMKEGAIDFLTKPFSEQDLMRAVNAAIEQDREARCKRAELAELHQRLSRLTPREREVLPLVVSGLLNKQAATELGISEITLQIHRGNIMKKMEAGSLAELVRIAGTLEIPITHSRRSRK